MSVYNYRLLSSLEFENLVRDVVEKLYAVRFECFTTGRDNGIDLRYAGGNEYGQIIVQAKCYKNYTDLYANLKKEKDKVRHLAPQRYLLVTSVGLTPQNKEKIKELFAPFICTTGDILGGDELDACIKKYPDILKRNYKLWLSSVDILNVILHSKVLNRSKFLLEDIREDVRRYVVNDSLRRALQLLSQHKYVIISGIPGIGKTALAQMLVYTLLAEGYQEFVYLNDSVDEGYEVFGEESRKQVFLFDDFLGKNYLEKRGMDLDATVLKFISHVQRHKNKMLILVAREYLLRQAEQVNESWKNSSVEIAKCTVDLNDYTREIRRQILCNHLDTEEVPLAHLENLCKNYLPVIDHPGYNPRIIKMLVERRIWEQCTAEEFPYYLKQFFDQPDKIWEFAYNGLDKLSQSVLVVLFSLGFPVLYEDFLLAVRAYLKTTGDEELSSTYALKKAVRTLEGTFIVMVPSNIGQVIVYKNSGVNDFIGSRIREEETVLAHLAESVVFVNQITSLFCENAGWRLCLDDEQKAVLVDRYAGHHEKMGTSVLNFIIGNEGLEFRKKAIEENIYFTLLCIVESFGKIDKRVEDIVVHYIDTHPVQPDDTTELKNFIRLLETIDLKKVRKPGSHILREVWKELRFLEDYWFFGWFAGLFPSAFKDLTYSVEFREALDKVIREEIGLKSRFEDIVRLESALEQFNQYYPFFEISKYNQLLAEREDVLYPGYYNKTGD